MKTEIHKVTIVCQQGIRTYQIGGMVNGALIHKIENNSVEYSDSIIAIYRGYTLTNDLVFEVIDAPVEIEYKYKI